MYPTVLGVIYAIAAFISLPPNVKLNPQRHLNADWQQPTNELGVHMEITMESEICNYIS